MPERSGDSSRQRHRWIAVALAAAGVALALGGHALATSTAGGRSLAQAAASTPSAAVSQPPPEVRAPWRPGAPLLLRLPTLGVEAHVVPVLAPGRTLVPPRDPSVLGWWADGAKPGADRGSVLIAGHTVHGAARGALDDLERVGIGAPVTVRTDRGVLRYVVTRVSTFRKAAIARRAGRLFTQTGPPRLVLVTCADWDGQQFLKNVVVVARPVGR